MSLPYIARLACLCFAAFFLLHTALAVAVSLLARHAVHRVSRFNPKTASCLLFAVRLFPASAATLLVGGLCAPSYLLFEPRATTEQISPVCVMAAILGIATCVSGLWRGALAAMRSARYLRRRGPDDLPLFVLAGVLRSRLIVAPAVREALTDEEFDAAVRHEEAHRRAKDNLKRLLILLAPDIFPAFRGFRTLDAGWRRLAEWAADDFAAAGSPKRALALASALVRVGRFRAAVPALPLSTSLLADGDDLRIRVERLTGNRADYQPFPRVLIVARVPAAIAALVLAPTMLHTVHRMMEALAR